VNLRDQLLPVGRDLVINSIIGGRALPRALRSRSLRRLGMDIDPSASICADVFFGGRQLTVGPQTLINYGCFFDLGAATTIGARCSLGYQVMVLTCTHEPGSADARAGTAVARPVVIEDGCWIGARATILPGVTVGRGCVVAAGSVVTTSCEPHGLYAGAPARRVRDLT